MSESKSDNSAVLGIPEFCVVALVGVSGSGKSTFARMHFRETEVLSSDFYRGLVCDDPNDQSVTADAFDALYYVARKRLARMKLTVIDATNVQRDARRQVLRLAKEYDALPVAIVLDIPRKVCEQRNATRPDRQFPSHVVRTQHAQLRRSLRSLRKEGFRHVHVLSGEEAVNRAVVERRRLWTDRRDLSGPFDFIGDIHGCYEELLELLDALDYSVEGGRDEPHVTPPPERKAVFLGDLVDRGPDSPAVLRLVMSMVRDGSAVCVPGNHDVKLVKWLYGKKVKISHGLAQTIEQLGQEPPDFQEEVREFLDGLVSHLVLDGGDVVAAHAGLREEYQGRASGRVRSFALYGETTGETDEFGLPVRYNWAMEYKGSATVVYGHTPVPRAEWLNRTINIDTGCVFGGALTALRYPERELVSVAAHRVYHEPARPLGGQADSEGARSGQHMADDVLDAQDVLGKRTVATALAGNVTIREENAAAALEVMSRFAIDPRWLIYLPPTMAPSATSNEPGYLEFPSEAFEYYRREGLDRVLCEVKHMGSRALFLVCRDEEVARTRFGAIDGSSGAIYSRTGRPFFREELHENVLSRTIRAAESAGLWDRLETDWILLDAEVMPWSLKAVELLKSQYAAVGAAATSSLSDTIEALRRTDKRGVDVTGLLEHHTRKLASAEAFVDAYRQYCWPFESIEDLQIAPFHVLASEGRVHSDRTHEWHLDALRCIVDADPGIFLATESVPVELSDPGSVTAAVDRWLEITGSGGEGFVVKPPTFVASGRKGFIQPAIKCRGPEYLRIIYGPDYQEPRHLSRLRNRSLGKKRSLARREFALGLEALERFVAREPLRRVHECVFGVLALESEPVDPRL